MSNENVYLPGKIRDRIASVIDLRNAAPPTPEERISASLPCLQIFALLLPLETACPIRRQSLSRVSGRKRYNTLDFAEQNRVPTGCCSPLLETQSQGDIPLWTPHVFFAGWYPNCKNAVCHRCEEKAKGSICARIVKAQIFLFMQVRSIIDYIFSPCNPL